MRLATACTALLFSLALSIDAHAQTPARRNSPSCVIPSGYSTPDHVIDATCQQLLTRTQSIVKEARSCADIGGGCEDEAAPQKPTAEFERYWKQIPKCEKVREILDVELYKANAARNLTAAQKEAAKRDAAAKIIAVVAANRRWCNY